MDKSAKLKNAIKIALAFALVYVIALKVNWLSPSWAGWSVVAIAASSAGQSIQKGLLRILGTLLGCVVGIAIISISPQNRWGFMLLASAWLFVSSYMMYSDKKHSYFWFVAGYVCLVITAAGPSPVGGFYLAIYRTMDTAMGIVVYTLIAVFIWPQSSAGAIKNAITSLLNTQSELLTKAVGMLSGELKRNRLPILRQQVVLQMDELGQAMQAEGSESYEVQEIKPLWNQVGSLSGKMVKSTDRLFAGIKDLNEADVRRFLPGLEEFIKEINTRLRETSSLLHGNTPAFSPQSLRITLNREIISSVSLLDKAALAIILNELNKIDADSKALLFVAKDIAGFQNEDQMNAPEAIKDEDKSGFKWHVPDIENLKGAFYVALVVMIGFIIWFFVNPPGHSTFYIMAGTFALLFGSSQHVRVIKLVFPFLIAMFCTSVIYIFILPKLTNVVELGILLFACMFVTQFVLSGAATLVFTVIILQTIVVTNPQQFNFSDLANGYVFVVLLLAYLFAMSYIINSPRPEKALLKQVSRFFKSAEYLISNHSGESKKSSSFISNFKTAFHLSEIRNLPAKIGKWGKSINPKLFPNTDDKRIEEMVASLQVLLLRIEVLMEANARNSENELKAVLRENLLDWKLGLENTFASWDDLRVENAQPNVSEETMKRLDKLEDKLDDIVAKYKDKVNEEEGIQFYHLLGGYRGVTEATMAFVNAADKIDWAQWREERFE